MILKEIKNTITTDIAETAAINCFLLNGFILKFLAFPCPIYNKLNTTADMIAETAMVTKIFCLRIKIPTAKLHKAIMFILY